MIKVIIATVFMAIVSSSFGGELPLRFVGRWTFNENATAEGWPARAKNDAQRERYRKIGTALKVMHEKFGKPLVAFIDASPSELVAHGGALNPRFEVLDASEVKGVAVVRARHFQVAGDDNPREVELRLSLVGDQLSIELWDEGDIMLLYVLDRKIA